MANINKRFGTDFSLTANVGGSFEDHYTRSIDVGKLMTVPNLFSLANVEPASGKETKDTYVHTTLPFAAGSQT